LVTDGVFHPNGVFRVFPPIPAGLLEQQLRRAVLEMLLQHVPDRGEHLVRYYGWVSQGGLSRERTQPGERTDTDVRAGGRDSTVSPPRKATSQLGD
jgi:hypothetical protein